MGGAEARFHLELEYDQAPVQLTFSRLYKLQNCYTIECERAQIAGRLFQPTRFDIVRSGRTESMNVGKPSQYQEYAWQLLENFIEVVQGNAPPVFTAADVAASIELIDEAYQCAKPFDMPWYENDPNVVAMRRQTISRGSQE